MRIYISGPMTGITNCNKEAFAKEAELWRSRGHFVINPHDITPLFGSEQEIAEAFNSVYGLFPLCKIDDDKNPKARLVRSVMEADLAALRSCDVIVMLQGWQSSRGARTELIEAIKCGLAVEDGE